MQSHIHRSFNLFVLQWAGPPVLFFPLALSNRGREREGAGRYRPPRLRSQMNNSHLPPRISFLMHLPAGSVTLAVIPGFNVRVLRRSILLLFLTHTHTQFNYLKCLFYSAPRSI